MVSPEQNQANEGLKSMELPSAAEIRGFIERKHKTDEDAKRAARQAREAELKQQRDAFLKARLTDDHIHSLFLRVKEAAESGAMEVMIAQFPCAWCSDGGRKINVLEGTWPDTLQGLGKEFFDFWQRELKPKGFRFRVSVVNFPGGMPGDVGAFLSWGEEIAR
jgi:hypothetical protein